MCSSAAFNGTESWIQELKDVLVGAAHSFGTICSLWSSFIPKNNKLFIVDSLFQLLWVAVAPLSTPIPAKRLTWGSSFTCNYLLCPATLTQCHDPPAEKQTQITLFPFNWAVCVEKKSQEGSSAAFWTTCNPSVHLISSFSWAAFPFSVLTGVLQGNSSSLCPILHLLVLLDASRRWWDC